MSQNKAAYHHDTRQRRPRLPDGLCSRKMAAAAEGLAAYRAVLRAARRTFAGDKLMLQESAVEIRRRFEDHRGLAPGSDEAARALADAREAAHFITHMIVQATRAPSGSFGTIRFCSPVTAPPL